MGASTMPRNKIIIILACVVLLLGLVLSYLQYNKLQELNDAVDEETMALSEAEAIVARLIVHRENAAEYRQRLVFVNRVMPEDAGEQELLRYFYHLADLTGATVSDISFGARVEEETFTRMPLSLSVEADFRSLQQMMDHFYSGTRVIRVDSLRVSPGGVNSSLRIAVSANAFYRTPTQ